MVGYGVVFLLLGTVCARLYSAYKKGTPTSGHTSHEHDSVAVDDPKVRVVRSCALVGSSAARSG